MNLDRLLARVPRWLGSKLNIVVGLALLVLLVALPLAGVPVSDHIELLGGNFTNVVSYVGASIAAGASVVNLHEGRRHRRRSEAHQARVEGHQKAVREALHTQGLYLDQIHAQTKRPAGR